jgi:branched-chain amino acid transport system substrate-binding protein
MRHRSPQSPRRRFLQGSAALVAASALPRAALAADPVKIGLILPLSGPFTSTGQQVEAAVRLYIAKNGDTVAGRKIELLVRDDTGLAPETTKRLAQELVTRDGVAFLAGFGLTPLALATAPIATEARVPMIVMAAATSIIVTRSPFIVRTGFTLPQVTAPIAEWAAKNNVKSAITLVTDYAPGIDAEKTFIKRFTDHGGKVVDSVRPPLRNPDYGPFLQRVKDTKPDALFAFVPSGEGAALCKQFADRGLAEAKVQLICTGDVLDDDLLQAIGAPAVGVVSSHHYSAHHGSLENKTYVEAFMAANGDRRPNFHSVGGYDGTHLIYEALRKTGGDTNGEKLVEAMKGMKWMSPRGPMSIDPATRDVVQNVYIRRCGMEDGKLWNIEFDKIANMKDPGPPA